MFGLDGAARWHVAGALSGAGGGISLAVYAGEAERAQNRIVELRVYDTRQRLAQGLLPVRIQVFFPDGTEAPYGEYTAVEEGRHIFEIGPAANEPRGQWKLKVTELAFGTTSEVALEVR